MNHFRFRVLLACAFVVVLTGKAMASDTSGQEEERGVAGIGAYTGPDVKGDSDIHHYILVLRVLDRSPAKKAGIQAGDEIVEIDGMKVAGMSLQEAVRNHLRGPLGSLVQVTIVRPGDQTRHKFDIIRQPTVDDKKSAP